MRSKYVTHPTTKQTFDPGTVAFTDPQRNRHCNHSRDCHTHATPTGNRNTRGPAPQNDPRNMKKTRGSRLDTQTDRPRPKGDEELLPCMVETTSKQTQKTCHTFICRNISIDDKVKKFPSLLDIHKMRGKSECRVP